MRVFNPRVTDSWKNDDLGSSLSRTPPGKSRTPPGKYLYVPNTYQAAYGTKENTYQAAYGTRGNGQNDDLGFSLSRTPPGKCFKCFFLSRTPPGKYLILTRRRTGLTRRRTGFKLCFSNLNHHFGHCHEEAA